jgi:membrane protein
VVLTRDLEVTTLVDLINALDLDIDLDASTAEAPWRTKVDGLIQQARSQSQPILTVKLRDILAGG